MHVKGVKKAYGLSMRSERLGYCGRRVMPMTDKSYVSIIADGASSEYVLNTVAVFCNLHCSCSQLTCYLLFFQISGYSGKGNFAGFDSGHTNFDLKFAATKFHGDKETGFIVIHLVAATLVVDNSNLMCQLLANALGHYSRRNRASSQAPTPRLPPKVMLQVDGVSTNWGIVTFAFLCFLVTIGAVASFFMARNPVGTCYVFLFASRRVFVQMVLLFCAIFLGR